MLLTLVLKIMVDLYLIVCVGSFVRSFFRIKKKPVFYPISLVLGFVLFVFRLMPRLHLLFLDRLVFLDRQSGPN